MALPSKASARTLMHPTMAIEANTRSAPRRLVGHFFFNAPPSENWQVAAALHRGRLATLSVCTGKVQTSSVCQMGVYQFECQNGRKRLICDLLNSHHSRINDR